MVDPAKRDDYVAVCVEAVEQARRAPGCLDFPVSADAVDPGRVNVFERWESAETLAAFRGAGPSGELMAEIRSASVVEYDVSGSRSLT